MLGNMFGGLGNLLHLTFLSFCVGPLRYSSAWAMSEPSELTAQQLQQSASAAWAQTGAQALYATTQQQWFEQNRTRKCGPPSTHGISRSGLTTPAEHTEDTEMAGAETTPQPPQSQEQPQSLIQPLGVEKDAAYAITASQMGVNAQDPQSYSSWMQTKITTLTTRQEVLDTIRAYHTTVIRSEIQNVVLQVEGIIKQLGDKLLRTHDNLQWLASELRQDQKKTECFASYYHWMVP